MTDNDIIKALEDKVNLIGSMTSVYLDEDDGFNLYEVLTSVLDLINRLETKNKEFDGKIVIQRGLIDRQQAEIERLTAFKFYFDELYGKGLDIANWHKNGDLEPFDSFYDSALEEMAGE